MTRAQPRKMQNAPDISRKRLTDWRKVGAGRECIAIRLTGGTSASGLKKPTTKQLLGGGTLVVMLIPARTDTKYFHEYIYKRHEIRFVRGRLHFNESKAGAPFPSMVVVMRPSDK